MKKIFLLLFVLIGLIYGENFYLEDGTKLINYQLSSVTGDKYEILYYNADQTSSIRQIDGKAILYIDYRQYDPKTPSLILNIGDKIFAEVESLKSPIKTNSTVIKTGKVNIPQSNSGFTPKGDTNILGFMDRINTVIYGVQFLGVGALSFAFGIWANSYIQDNPSAFEDMKKDRNLLYALGVISTGLGVFFITYEHKDLEVSASTNALSISYKF